MVAVGVVRYYPHAPVDFDDLLPVRQLARTVVLDRFEFVRVPVSSF